MTKPSERRLRVNGVLIEYKLVPTGETLADIPGGSPAAYMVHAPGVLPFRVEFPNYLRTAREFLFEVYTERDRT